MLAMETPARSASARTSAADVPSAMARPSRSLRISTVAMPSARASAKKSRRLRRGTAMWFRAKRISATQTPAQHRSRPQDMRPAECRTPRRDRARTSLGRTDVAAGIAASTTSGPSPSASSSSSMEQTDHYSLLMERLFHFGSIVNALEPGSRGQPSSRSAPGRSVVHRSAVPAIDDRGSIGAVPALHGRVAFGGALSRRNGTIRGKTALPISATWSRTAARCRRT